MSERSGTPPTGTPGPESTGPGAIDVVIPVLNEADVIAEAVEHARRLGTVHVVDSGSTDATVARAAEAGAHVTEHPFDGPVDQRNWSLDELPLRGDWVLVLEADERCTPGLRDELLAITARGDGPEGVLVDRLLVFGGRRVRHGGLSPWWSLRMVRRGARRFVDDRAIDTLPGEPAIVRARDPLVHARAESISRRLERSIALADAESTARILRTVPESILRRPAGRSIPTRLGRPFEPLIIFLSRYLLRLGFLDEHIGYHLAVAAAQFEYMVRVLQREKLHRLAAGQYLWDEATDRLGPAVLLRDRGEDEAAPPHDAAPADDRANAGTAHEPTSDTGVPQRN